MGSILDNEHWCCFFANLNTFEFYYLNPYGSTEKELENVVNNWRIFSKQELNIKEEFQLPLVQHSIQTDNYHCGVYVCIFMECLWNNNLNGLIFDASEEFLMQKRRSIHNVLTNLYSKDAIESLSLTNFNK
jgi:Ulp1 family protease